MLLEQHVPEPDAQVLQDSLQMLADIAVACLCPFTHCGLQTQKAWLGLSRRVGMNA